VAIRGATFGSMGDVASKGTGGGIVSSNVEGPTSFVGPGSMDVKIEGKNVQLLGDPMLNNGGPSGSPANAATMMGVLQTTGFVTAVDGKDACPLCDKQHGSLEETKETKVDASALASKLDAMLKSKKGRRLVTMLGVVQCKCGQKYADHSSMTLFEFCDVVKELGWHAPPGSLSIDDINDNEKTDKAYNDTRAKVRDRLLNRCSDSPKAVEAVKRWADAEELASESYQNREKAAAYPPGVCAAQKAIVLVWDGGAYPGALTEQWFHSKSKPTTSPIQFFDAAAGKVDVRAFEHGETVPPCKTCELIIPLMLCPGEWEDKCQHKD
jgi:hypothetical protein